ncbi:L-rhamnose mutarotase [Maribacter sp. MAR_2009_72]|uniref:L-rhamnose mutarotase n=1 Tax=Maribacter sp. MAR_2009_72 TaxID=1250050 RepID=UPI00119A1B27|nr:L-rhamnose mutarotase [Maribacter sp. MAR_2009_72]TVZ14942.1 L-rhamnose mutarotase [Maribacter sp. MAR_2009_72]
MIRKAFKMKLFSNKVQEYTQRHNPICPELEDTLKKHGVTNYSIFLDSDTDTLFGYAEIESEEKWNAIAETTICKKWWAYLANLMDTHDNNSPVSKELNSVFFIS